MGMSSVPRNTCRFLEDSPSIQPIDCLRRSAISLAMYTTSYTPRRSSRFPLRHASNEKKARARRANNLKGGADRSSHEYANLKWTPNMMAAYVPYLRQPMCSPHLYSCHPLLYSNNKPVACEMHGSTFIHNALVYCYLAHLYHGRIISGGSFCSQHRGL